MQKNGKEKQVGRAQRAKRVSHVCSQMKAEKVGKEGGVVKEVERGDLGQMVGSLMHVERAFIEQAVSESTVCKNDNSVLVRW